MKKILPLVLILVACSSTPEAPDGVGASPGDGTGTADTGAMFAPDSGVQAAADTGALATPVEPAKTEVPPAPTLAGEAAASEVAATSAPPPAPTKMEAKEKSMYELFDEHMQARKLHAKDEREWEQRALFYHEGGKYQLGLDYSPKAFPDYDFDRSATVRTFDTQGAMFSFLYFPLASLDYGRLGVGPNVGFFLTKYAFTTQLEAGGTKADSNRVRSFLSYGARIKYEFQYFLGQLFVPFVYFGYDRVSVRAFQVAAAGLNFPKNNFDSQAYGGGLSMNLNRLEPSSGSRSLVSSGIKKYYLTYTYEPRSDAPSSGKSHLLGLRFEY